MDITKSPRYLYFSNLKNSMVAPYTNLVLNLILSESEKCPIIPKVLSKAFVCFVSVAA